jgi:HD-like signal output (HDOD) protein
MRLDELLKQPHALPTVPQVVHELIRSFDQEDVSIHAITKSISADPVLSAKLLRLANSSYYHVSRSIATVEDSVVMLGFMTVRTLVVGAGMAGAFPSVPGMDLQRFWRYSTHAAAVSSWIAKHAQCSRDHAFTVGLMHGLGHLVMHSGMPEPTVYLDKACGVFDARRSGMERSSFGFDHADVTAALLAHWKLPAILVDAVARHIDPLAHAQFDPLAATLHLATWRARAHEADLTRDELSQTVPQALCAKLNLPVALLLDEMPPLEELAEGLGAIAQ